MWIAILLTLIIGVFLFKQFFPERKPKNNFDFWGKYGIRQIDTSAAISSVDIARGTKSQSDSDDYAYAQLGPSEKYCGIWENEQPKLLIKDIDFLKKVLIKDFDHFVNRTLFFTKQDGILGNMLSSLQDKEWKGVRASISPAFTTAKIRRMMDYFNSVSLEWVAELKAKSNSNGRSVKIDVIKAVNQYTTEVISSSVFGMRTDAVKNPNSIFNVMANRVADFGSFKATVKFAFRRHFPKLFKLLGLSPFDMESISFFEGILEQNIKSRENEEKGKRNDFLQLLILAKNVGGLEASKNEKLETFENDAQIILKEGSRKKQWITDEMVRAQSIMFFFAGLSSTSNLITMVMYALALHQDIQDRLRDEVKKIVKIDGSLDYDDVGQLVYLDMVINGKHEKIKYKFEMNFYTKNIRIIICFFRNFEEVADMSEFVFGSIRILKLVPF